MRLFRLTSFALLIAVGAGVFGVFTPATASILDNVKVAQAQNGPTLTLTPNERTIVLQPGQTFKFMALWDTNGNAPGEVYDVTGQADWSFSDPSGYFGNRGELYAQNLGGGTVTVSFQGQSENAFVQIGISTPPGGYSCSVGNGSAQPTSFPVFSTGANTGVWGWEFNPPIPNLLGGGNGVFDIQSNSFNYITTTAPPQTSRDGPNGKPSNQWWFNVSPSIPFGSHLMSVSVAIESEEFNGTLQCNDISVLYAAPEYAQTPSFDCAATEIFFPVYPGEFHDFTIRIEPSGGFSGPVTFSANSVTPDVANKPTVGSFSPNPTSSGTTIVRISTTAQTPSQDYSIIFLATSGSISDTCGVQLRVNPSGGDFELELRPFKETPGSIPPDQGTPNRILVGQNKVFTVTAVCTGGFTGPITNLEVFISFAGASATFQNPGGGPNGTTLACGDSTNITVSNTQQIPEGQLSSPSNPPGINLKDIVVQGKGLVN